MLHECGRLTLHQLPAAVRTVSNRLGHGRTFDHAGYLLRLDTASRYPPKSRSQHNNLDDVLRETDEESQVTLP